MTGLRASSFILLAASILLLKSAKLKRETSPDLAMTRYIRAQRTFDIRANTTHGSNNNGVGKRDKEMNKKNNVLYCIECATVCTFAERSTHMVTRKIPDEI